MIGASARFFKTEKLPCLGRYQAGGVLEKEREAELYSFIEVTAKKHIGKRGSSLPLEDRKEIKSIIFEYFVENFDRVSSEKNWQGYVERCCSGLVKNYKRDNGRRWNELVDADADESIDEKIDHAHLNWSKKQGVELIDINWDLLSRLCSADRELHAFVKMKILSYSLKELEYQFNVNDQRRVWDLVEAFLSRFRKPITQPNQWFLQICFALGICELMGLEPIDQKIGYGLEKVDLFENRVAPKQIVFNFEM